MTTTQAIVLPRPPAARPAGETDKFILDQVGQALARADVELTRRTVSGELLLTMDGASTLTLVVLDEDRKLVRSGVLFRRPRLERAGGRAAKTLTLAAELAGLPRLAAIDITVDDVVFRLVGVERHDDHTVTLTLEDRAWYWLRDGRRFIRASRARSTRAQFIQRMVFEVRRLRNRFYSPDVAVDQPIAKARATQTQRDRDAQRGSGFASGATITVKGDDADPHQRRVITDILRACHDEGASRRVSIAAVMCSTQESACRELGHGDTAGPDSRGPFQQRASWGPLSRRKKAYSATKLFLAAWKRTHGGLKADGNLAAMIQAVQISADGSLYKQWEDEATRTVDAWDGGSQSVKSEYTKTYYFTRGEPGQTESTTDAAQRLAEEVNWRFFAAGGWIYFVSDETLLRARPLATIREGATGIRAIRWKMDLEAIVTEAEVDVLADRWGLQPGGNVEMEAEGDAADGRWMIWTWRRPLWTDEGTLALRRPSLPKPEPASETVTRSTDGDEGSTVSASIDASGAYRGTKAVIDQIVTPFLRDRGLSPGSAKRTPAENAAVGGSADSDHLTTNSSAYAVDYPTTNGEASARALARELGWTTWAANSYARFDTTIDGKRFRIQILWGSGIGHGDHIHVGVSRL